MGIRFVIAVYAVFVIAYYNLPLPVVVTAWIVCAVIAAVLMMRTAPDDAPSWLGGWMVIGSLLIWPIQIATLKAWRKDEVESDESRKASMERIGSLPVEINGVVSFVDYIDAETPYYLVWLEEYAEVAIQASVELYGSIGLADGAQVYLTIDERESEDGSNVIYVVDGTLSSS